MGGTDIYSPLKYVFDSYRVHDEINLPRNIFLLTDGEIEDKSKTLDLIDKNSSKYFIYSIGIGNYFDEDLIKNAGIIGKGAYNFCKDIQEINKVIVKEINRAISPFCSNINIKSSLDNDNLIKNKLISNTLRDNEIINLNYIINNKEKNNNKINIEIIYLENEEKVEKKYEIIPYYFPEGEELSKLIINNYLKDKNLVEEELKLALRYQIFCKNTSLFAEIELSKKVTGEMKEKILENQKNNQPYIHMKPSMGMGMNMGMGMGMNMGMGMGMNMPPPGMIISPPPNNMGMMIPPNNMGMMIPSNNMGMMIPPSNMGMMNGAPSMNMGMMNGVPSMNMGMMNSPPPMMNSAPPMNMGMMNSPPPMINSAPPMNMGMMNSLPNNSMCMNNNNLNNASTIPRSCNDDCKIKDIQEKINTNEKDDIMKIINTQNFINGFWEANEYTNIIKEKYKEEFNLLIGIKNKNITDKVAITFLIIYFIEKEHPELLDELLMIIKKAKIFILNETKETYENITKEISIS